MVGATGFAVLKFETHALQNGEDPLDPSYQYYSQCRDGLDYIFAQAVEISISPQPAGDPDVNGNGVGTYFSVYLSERGYETCVAMMAIAASSHPEMIVNVLGSVVDGDSYFDVLQDAVDYIAFAQGDPPAAHRGSWRYTENYGSGDNSISGFATLALAYSEATQIEGATGFACIVPQWVKDELSLWIDYIQNDVDGGPDDGGSGYNIDNYWVNILKTGNLLVEMAFVGDTPATQRVIDAVDYIERHWNDNYEPGWRGTPASYLTMFSTVKGLDAFGIDLLDVGGSPVDWFDEMADVIIAQQNLDGSWPTEYWDYENGILSTEWALLFLQRVTPIEPPVGGEILPINAVRLLAPYLLILILVVSATALLFKKRIL